MTIDTKSLPPVDVLHSLFDVVDGKLIRRTSGRGVCRAGDVVSSRTTTGYVRVSIDGSHYLVHRIVYVMVNGPIPEGLFIDHINGIRDDNRVGNLRLVTHQENGFNYTNAVGYRFDEKRGKFRSFIKRDGKTRTLGQFDDEVAALSSYSSAKLTLHPIQTR